MHTALHHIDSLFVNAEPSPTCRHNTRRFWLQAPAKDTTGGWVNHDFYYYLQLVCGT